MKTLHHFVNGKKVSGQSGRVGAVYNPATGEQEAEVPFASADETRLAIRAAQAALAGWSATPAVQRARVLFRFKDLMERHKDEMAALVTAEHGKTLPDAGG